MVAVGEHKHVENWVKKSCFEKNDAILFRENFQASRKRNTWNHKDKREGESARNRYYFV